MFGSFVDIRTHAVEGTAGDLKLNFGDTLSLFPQSFFKVPSERKTYGSKIDLVARGEAPAEVIASPGWSPTAVKQSTRIYILEFAVYILPGFSIPFGSN